jgi:pimeloyl-ACP methyl ester carboxylesterase
VLVGDDFGGPVALRLLMRDPDAYTALVLVATNLFSDTPIPFPLSLVNAPLVGGAAARPLFARAALAGMCRFGARQGNVYTSAALGDATQAAAIRLIFVASLHDLPGLYGSIAKLLPGLAHPDTSDASSRPAVDEVMTATS